MSDRKDLDAFIGNEVTLLFQNTLDYLHVVLPKHQYLNMRAKVLRLGNDCIRNISNRLEDYDIEWGRE